MKRTMAFLLLLLSGSAYAEDSYWYYIQEDAVFDKHIAFKYSKVLQCEKPIQQSNQIISGFALHNAVGPFKSYQDADAARSNDLNIAIQAGKNIKLAVGVCSQ